MSIVFEKLCKSILLEHFGAIVEAIAIDLFQRGPRTLSQIKVTTKLPLTKVNIKLHH